MKHTNKLSIKDMTQVLSKKFGETVVKTQTVSEYVASIGQNYSNYYVEMRNTYGVGHGKLQFIQADSDEISFDSSNDSDIVYEVETSNDIEKRINLRFNALNIMARATAKGINRAMIVSGPAGLGKSFGVERAAEEIVGDFAHIKGYIRPTGLYKTLYANRHKGNLIVFDDIDSIFQDDTSLNILKAACDSGDVRKISWLSNAVMETEDGETIPSSFVFEGSVIFITNICFEEMINKGSRMSPHYEALMSRSHYLSLGIRSKKDYIVRIKQVLRQGMLDSELSETEKNAIVSFMEDNIDRMRELSLRMVKKLAGLYMMDKEAWKDLAQITCMK
jgi:hypothetical protein